MQNQNTMIQLNENEKEILINHQDIHLKGILGIPDSAKGIIIFAHGSGSGRISPRNNYVARHLQKKGLATLLLDLLSEKEALDRSNVFNILLLSERLSLAKNWVMNQPKIMPKKVGYFGASTGAGAALISAALGSDNIFALVSRGGRPDLAKEYLRKVLAPTLLIVGGNDEAVINLNEEAYAKLTCEKKMEIIPGATHLFEEPGTLESVAEKASDWFLRFL